MNGDWHFQATNILETTICHSHITLQPKDWLPTEAKQVEPGQYLDGRPPGKTRLLLEEVLVRPAGVLTLWSVWVLTPQYSDGDSIL